MLRKYYKTSIFGIDESFNGNLHDIYNSNHESYKEIIVTKALNGYKEILTGKKYKILTPDIKTPTFIKEDNLKEASKQDIKKYIEKNYRDQFYLLKLNSIEITCHCYLNNNDNKKLSLRKGSV